MALRLVEFRPPEGFQMDDDVLDRHGIVTHWRLKSAEDDGTVERILLRGDRAEAFVEWLDEAGAVSEDRRALILQVEAVVPRVEEEQGTPRGEEKEEATIGRISRDELFQDATEATELTPTYYGLVGLSTVVAIGGMMRDNTAVVIGAMVIAPLIGPNMGLALATTLGDTDLLKRAMLANLSGLALGLAMSILAGAFLAVDASVPELALRARVAPPDLLLALAAGAAGAMSFTRGISASLIGVMVAVALLPPLVALGLFIGAGLWDLVWSSALLLLTNVVSVNLAAVCTFLVQGVRPMRWYEEERARRATRIAIALWVVALVLLAAGIWLAGGPDSLTTSP